MRSTTSTLPGDLCEMELELRTYYKRLPALLKDKEDGRHVVIRGEETYDTWDTYRDAVQFAREKFPDGEFLVQVIDARFLSVLRPHFEAVAGPMAEVA